MCTKQVEEYNKIKENPIYYLENYTMDDNDPLKKNEGYFDLYPEMNNVVNSILTNKYNIINVSRQMYTTTTLAGLVAHKIFNTTEPQNIHYVTNDIFLGKNFLDLVQNNLKRLVDKFTDKTEFVTRNNQNLIFILNNSELKIVTNAIQFTGLKSDWVIMENTAQIERADEIFYDSFNFLVPGGKYTIVSSPHKKEGFFYDMVHNNKHTGAVKFKYHKLPWYLNPKLTYNLVMVNFEEKKLRDAPVKMAMENLMDMGYEPSSEWHRTMSQGMPKNTIKREFWCEFVDD